MAFIIMTTGKAVPVPPRVGAEVWMVMTGEMFGTPEQKRFVKRVRKVILNRANAPKSYLDKHPVDEEPSYFGPPRRRKQVEAVAQARLPYNDD